MTVGELMRRIRGVKFLIINSPEGDIVSTLSDQYFYTLDRPTKDLVIDYFEVTRYKGCCLYVTLKPDKKKKVVV